MSVDTTKRPRSVTHVNKYLRESNYFGYELVRGEGYFYWSADGTLEDEELEFGHPSSWHTSGVYVYRTSDLPYEKRLAEFLYLAKNRCRI